MQKQRKYYYYSSYYYFHRGGHRGNKKEGNTVDQEAFLLFFSSHACRMMRTYDDGKMVLMMIMDIYRRNEPGPGHYNPTIRSPNIRAITFGSGPQRPHTSSKYDIKPGR